MANANTTTVFSPNYSIKIHKWKVREGFQVNNNQIILLYAQLNGDDKEIKRLKSSKCGIVKRRHYRDGDTVDVEKPLLELSDCIHATVIKDMCADCGADLRQDDNGNQSEANVPMVHSVPELKVSQELALELGKADTVRLLKDRKLVLLVDLDQTVIHTTNDNVPNNLKGVYHFQLYGPNSPWYHTRIRPGTFEFLERIAPKYELHICTFGARNYAHTIAQFLDEDGKYFSHRILSRDECLSLTFKNDNLKALFPCGDSMVCIIDDREDVWNMATNLIQVKPYHFFQHTGDINAPPGLSKHELDGKGIDFKDFEAKAKAKKEEANSSDEDEPKKTIETEKKEESSKGLLKHELDGKGIDFKEFEAKAKAKKEDANSTDEDEPKKTIETQKKEETIENENEKNESNNETVVEGETSGDGEHITVDDEEKQSLSNDDHKDSDKQSDGEEKIDVVNMSDVDKPSSSTKSLSENFTEDNLIEIEDPDDYLLYLKSILFKIHERFYSYYDEHKQIPDLKSLVPRIRSEVLVGKVLVFSGLVPTQVKLETSRAYLIARSLGATVTQQLTDETTHLVASTAGTFKVNAAKKMPNIHIVSPEWLWTCVERWECVEELLFPLDSQKSVKSRQPPAHCHSPEHVPDYSNLSEGNPVVPNDEVKFIDTINPILSFSNDDLEAMNKDVDEFFESDSSSDDDEEEPSINDVKTVRGTKRRLNENLDNEEVPLKRKNITEKDIDQAGPSRRTKNDDDGDDVDDDEVENDSNSSSNNSSRSSDSDSKSSKSDEDSDEESMNKKFRRGENLPSDLDLGSDDSGDSAGSNDENNDEDDGEWNMMGAALEREFLDMD